MRDTLSEAGERSKALIAISVAIVVISLVVFGLYSYLAPESATVQNNAYNNSVQHTDAMAQRLADYNREYLTAKSHKDLDHMHLIQNIVVHEYASYDETRLPSYLQDFLRQMRAN